jgi:pimeloyl-ACP methyl ester carboxylesterase
MALFVNLRNVFQVLVSSDRRYGPIYSLGVGQECYRGLIRKGYHDGSDKPVFLIGWSGGGQISLGAATFLDEMVDGPLEVISVGGFMSSDPGLYSIRRLTHLYGTKDPLQGLGPKVFPGRWPISKTSAWNKAAAQGKITLVELGPFNHNVKQHYFDMVNTLPDGRTYAEKTIDEIVKAIEGSMAREKTPVVTAA